MAHLPSVIAAKYARDYCIHLTFDDGVQADVDFQPWIQGEIFEPLKKKIFFKKFFLDGATVVWPNGADIAPETLYEAALTVIQTNPNKIKTVPERRI